MGSTVSLLHIIDWNPMKSSFIITRMGLVSSAGYFGAWLSWWNFVQEDRRSILPSSTSNEQRILTLVLVLGAS
ncbi:hypothetical protein MRB53_023705 [Persea americana]|uniref:Uncharacterized protein n=1 Tax=Persea americana TaxID=3435 RepID=A0ACC2LAI3_PERAE|nr:hypothetical protein MRB53_023705 [Persea americana]